MLLLNRAFYISDHDKTINWVEVKKLIKKFSNQRIALEDLLA